MLENEEAIIGSLTGRFEFLKGKCVATRVRRIFAEAPRERVPELAGFIRHELLFSALNMITGLDTGDHFQIIYHFSNADGIVINLKADAPKTDPAFESIMDIYQNAVLYEIEIHNLFGIPIRGIPSDIGYPLPDGWPEGQYPLRKDWVQPGNGEPVMKGEVS